MSCLSNFIKFDYDRIQSEREPHFVLLENKEPIPNIKLHNMPTKAQVNTSRPKETNHRLPGPRHIFVEMKSPGYGKNVFWDRNGL